MSTPDGTSLKRRLRGAACTLLVCCVLALNGCTGSSDAALGQSGLNLPRVAWEGGPAYWDSFAKAKSGGWTDPSFFPIVAWYDGVSSPEEAAFDKSLGINTYIGMPDTLDSSLLDSAGMYWIGGQLNGMIPATTP